MPDILLWLMTFGLLGLVIYAFVEMFRGASSEPLPPIDATGWTLVVDGSNFAHRGTDVRLAYLQEVLEELERRFENAELRVFCDANLRYKFEGRERRKFDKLVKHSRSNLSVRETHGKQADEVILKYARKNSHCIVVSNDRFGKGDEIELRIDVPLLQVEIMETAVRLFERVDIFKDEERAVSVAVDDLVGSK